MNLEQRRFTPTPEWELELERLYDSRPRPFALGQRRLSIWRMELPNTPYAAPQAAFWWVSNEGSLP